MAPGAGGSKNGYYLKDMVPILGGAPFTEADEYLYDFFHSKSVANVERLNDPALDVMIDEQRALVNEDERVKAVLDIQRHLAEQR